MEEHAPICTECDCEAETGTFYGDPKEGPVIHKTGVECIRALKEQRDRLQQEMAEMKYAATAHDRHGGEE